MGSLLDVTVDMDGQSRWDIKDIGVDQFSSEPVTVEFLYPDQIPSDDQRAKTPNRSGGLATSSSSGKC